MAAECVRQAKDFDMLIWRRHTELLAVWIQVNSASGEFGT